MLANTFVTDLRYGARLLAKNRWFTAAAVLSLALGIGANTAIFSVVSAVLLRPLPFHDADRLVLVWGTDEATGKRRGQVSNTDIADVRAANDVFENVATFMFWKPALSGDGEPERLSALQVSDEYFDVLRATPAAGRLLVPEDQLEGNDFVVVLSYGLWQRRFNGDPSIVGRTITLNGRGYTVVGVLAANVPPLPTTLVDAPAELYRPVAEPYDDSQRDARHLRAIARLRPDVDIGSAQSSLDVIGRRLAEAHPNEDAGGGFNVVSLREDTVGNVRPALLALLGAVGFVLLIACANVSNLLLARAVSRRKEVAIRASLGASAWRLARQALTESLLLGLLGGAAGLLLATWVTGFVSALGASSIPSLGAVELDRTVLLFTFGVSMIAGLAFGVVPAIYAAHPDLERALRAEGARDRTREEAGCGAGSSSPRRRWRSSCSSARGSCCEASRCCVTSIRDSIRIACSRCGSGCRRGATRTAPRRPPSSNV